MPEWADWFEQWGEHPPGLSPASDLEYVSACMERPDITPAQVAEGNIMADLLHGRMWGNQSGGIGTDNPKCCPRLRITRKTRQLMACVTYSDGQAMPWCDGGSSKQPLWWLLAKGAIDSAMSAHYAAKAKPAAEDTSGGS